MGPLWRSTGGRVGAERVIRQWRGFFIAPPVRDSSAPPQNCRSRITKRGRSVVRNCANRFGSPRTVPLRCGAHVRALVGVASTRGRSSEHVRGWHDASGEHGGGRPRGLMLSPCGDDPGARAISPRGAKQCRYGFQTFFFSRSEMPGLCGTRDCPTSGKNLSRFGA